MNKKLLLIKKACNLLGVGMMLIGAMPTPVIAQVDAVAEVVEPSAVFDVEFLSFDQLLGDLKASAERVVLDLDMTADDGTWIHTAILDGESDPRGTFGDGGGGGGGGSKDTEDGGNTGGGGAPPAPDELLERIERVNNFPGLKGKVENDKKITICHVQYGRPWDQVQLTISENAWADPEDCVTDSNAGPHGEGCHGGDYLGACEPYEPICGDGAVEPPEECDDGNTVDGDGCSATCVLEYCGNGVLDPGEGCDDGNTDPGDGCSPTCQVEECGNGILDPGEECDGEFHCLPNCTWDEWCGDGIVNGSETCDDGNAVGGDGCSANCQIEGCTDPNAPNYDPAAVVDDGSCESYCGDGTTDSGETCDDGNTVGGDGCSAECQIEGCTDPDAPNYDPTAVVDDGSCDPYCGNGTIDSGETCDDGNTVGDDGCSAECQIEGCTDPNAPNYDPAAVVDDGSCDPYCGDGVVQPDLNETCDPGDPAAPPDCDSTCTYCGDDIVDEGEECEPGLDEHCSDSCEMELWCGDGLPDPGNEECDPAALPGDDAYHEYCRRDCTIPVCGDGITDGELGETCDGEAYCRDDCTFCGDEVLQEGHGETCDGQEYCRDDCTYCGDALINGNEICDYGDPDQDYCDDTCDYKDFEALVLNSSCVGVGTLGWSVTNPNPYSVPLVNVKVQGNVKFDGTFPADSKVSMGTTADGPAEHEMKATWPGGTATKTSSEICESEFTPAGLPIPVTPGEPLIIPVTGVDILSMMADKQQALMAAGSALLGISFMIGSKKKKK